MARSRFHRSADALPPLRLTPRDDAILSDVARLGPCLVEHLRRLHFPSYKTAAERAMKLFHHGFLERLPLPAETGQPTMAHALAPRGVEHIAGLGLEPGATAVATEEADPTHAVEVAGVLVDFLVAGRHPGIELPVVEAAPAGARGLPDALVVIDLPARLFRRTLLLDVARPEPAATRARLAEWKAWAARPPATIEGELNGMLVDRGIAASKLRARVSIGLVVPDAAALDDVARAAVEAGCGALLHMASLHDLRTAGPLGPVWTKARDRASDGARAQRTSVLAV